MTTNKKKISIIGAGQIGSTIALLLGQKNLGDIFLFDIIEGMPQGKALDLIHCMSVINSPTYITGTNEYSDLQDSDVVIITAGVPRKPNMTRSDLLSINAKIISSVAENIKEFCPNSFVICITNPLDAMVYYFKEKSGFASNMVCGMAGVLDSSRFKCHLSQKLGVRPNDISAIVIGGHGDRMIPMRSSITVGGLALSNFIRDGQITNDELDAIIKRTAFAGGEILDLLKTSSAFFAPAASAVAMVEAYIKDSKALLVCSAEPNGEYGVKGLFVGVPVIIGSRGVEKVVEVEMSGSEEQLFKDSIESIKELLETMKSLNL
ncbi:lactate/malate dehydrogenase, NAD binding domain-containing protein [Cryptosporidium muris RN66]|uniref:L-lactate dehydrogenase n=1 Tax=Cryptosporidium muris (strain RN66) TaxID=441375 RepID=B6AHM2_CRYMR|nr:lactate/malate dehydrogenase, NAD binding domain-containing protein [Cryptosporidium muris RN66]EEA07717.1 lactate/malate dehydrogenase, NAD binding domain-containing protein [Cryptosporidium muris RN66]|eukprot:XP_002142066.1 lactate/malate dehydrogenase, NAD binding domain-containing protein [Cryptosporidium muris RN66]